MNKDQVVGRAKDLKGDIKEVVGRAIGSEKLEAEGLADQAAGNAQAAYGDAKNAGKSVVDSVKDGAKELAHDIKQGARELKKDIDRKI